MNCFLQLYNDVKSFPVVQLFFKVWFSGFLHRVSYSSKTKEMVVTRGPAGTVCFSVTVVLLDRVQEGLHSLEEMPLYYVVQVASVLCGASHVQLYNQCIPAPEAVSGNAGSCME